MVYITKEKATSIIRLKMCSQEVALQHLIDFNRYLYLPLTVNTLMVYTHVQ